MRVPVHGVISQKENEESDGESGETDACGRSPSFEIKFTNE